MSRAPEGLLEALEADAEAWLELAESRRGAGMFLNDAARFEISAANARAAVEEIRALHALISELESGRSPEPTIEETAVIIHGWKQAPPVPGPVDPREYFPKK